MKYEQNAFFQDFKILNNFLYKYLFLNLLINSYFYFYPGVYLPFIIYIFSIIFFLIKFSKIYKKYYFCFFAQIISLFAINITYLNFILSVILNNFYLKQDMEYILEFVFYCDLETYFIANSYLIVFSIIIIFFSNFINFQMINKTIEKLKIQNLNINIKKNYFLIIIFLFFEFIYFFSGTLGSQIAGTFVLNDPDDYATWYTHFYYFLVSFHLLLNLILLKNNEKSRFKKFFLIISFFLNFIFYGFFLRRMAVQFLFIAIVIYFMITEKKIKKIKFFILNVILISLLFQFTNFLQVIRTSEIYAVRADQNFKDIVTEGKIFQYFTNQDMRKDARNISMENISKRIFNNHELATIFYHQKNTDSKYLYGKLVRNHFIGSIPQKIFPNKKNYLKSDLLISTVTPSPLYYMDTNDSIHSFSYIDFGLFGLVIYPILIILICILFYNFINFKFINNLTSLLILILLLPMYSLRITEIDITEWFVLIRNILIFTLIFNYILNSKDLINKK